MNFIVRIVLGEVAHLLIVRDVFREAIADNRWLHDV